MKVLNWKTFLLGIMTLVSCGRSDISSGIWQRTWKNYIAGYVIIEDSLVKYVPFFEEEDSIAFTGNIVHRSGNKIEFNIDGTYPGTLFRNPVDEALWVIVEDINDGKNIEWLLSEENHLSKISSIEEKADERRIFKDKNLSDVIYTAEIGEPFSYTNIYANVVKITLPDNTEGYVPMDKNWIFSGNEIMPVMIQKTYLEMDGKYDTYFEFKRLEGKAIIKKTSNSADGRGTDTVEYYMGNIERNSILVNSYSNDYDDYDDYENMAFDRFEPVDRPFRIYFLFNGNYLICVDKHIYYEQEF